MRTDSTVDRLELAKALFARSQRDKDGFEAFRKKYPSAPEAMLRSAVHHVYVDGADAALAFLARAESFIRNPTDNEAAIDYAITFELLYHVYNWHQFQLLLPEGKQDILDLLAEIKQFVAEDDREALVKTVEELQDVIEASRSNPDFELGA